MDERKKYKIENSTAYKSMRASSYADILASGRGYIDKTCAKKRRFPNRKLAARAAMKKACLRRSTADNKGRWGVYLCPFCQGWHITSKSRHGGGDKSALVLDGETKKFTDKILEWAELTRKQAESFYPVRKSATEKHSQTSVRLLKKKNMTIVSKDEKKKHKLAADAEHARHRLDDMLSSFRNVKLDDEDVDYFDVSGLRDRISRI